MNNWKLSALLAALLAGSLSACGGGSSPATESYTPTGAIVAPRLLSSDLHGGGIGWARQDCLLCHPMTKVEVVHGRVPAIKNSLIRLAARLDSGAQGACLACHDTNGLEPATSRRCLICHGDNQVVAGAAKFSGEHQHTISDPGGAGLKDGECLTCHHRSDMDGTFDPDVDLTGFGADQDYSGYGGLNDFCLACHDISGVNVGGREILPPPLRFPEFPETAEFTDLKRTFVGSEGDPLRLTADIHGFKDGRAAAAKSSGNGYRSGYEDRMVLACTDCHQVHSSANPYLITESGASAAKLAAADPTRSAAINIGDGRRFNELCALCHYHESGPVAANGLREIIHAAGGVSGDCVSCHYHGAGYNPPYRVDLF